jgi:putative transposase
MPDIMMLLAGLSHGLNATTLRRLATIVKALLSMTGRVTMLGMSRWSEPGGSYRTIQRFFNTKIAWGKVHWLIIRQHLLDPSEVLLMAGDEVVVTKSGKKTHGLERFFSSLYGKAVPSVCFLSLSLISVRRGTSYPVRMEQVVRERVPSSPKAVKKPTEGQRGRPKGSGNRNRREVALSPDLRFVQETIRAALTLIGGELAVRYLLYDGAFGHNEALQRVRQTGLHLISKLRHDAALYFPYAGPDAGRGRRRKYGNKLDYRRIPDRYLKSSLVDHGIRTAVYQMLMWHKCFAEPLNSVLLLKTNLRTGATAHVVLFSSDRELPHDRLVHYYRLRFQLEFNFRDAKQYWGLEDFMVVKSTPVTNSANLAMLMVNLSQALIRPLRAQCPAFSVNDLKAGYRGRKYVLEALKWLPTMPEPIVIDQAIAQVTQLGRINYATIPLNW